MTGSQKQITDVARALAVRYEKVLVDNSDYVVDHSAVLSIIDPTGFSAVTFALAEPYIIAAKLFEVLGCSGADLDAVHNLGAYR